MSTTRDSIFDESDSDGEYVPSEEVVEVVMMDEDDQDQFFEDEEEDEDEDTTMVNQTNEDDEDEPGALDAHIQSTLHSRHGGCLDPACSCFVHRVSRSLFLIPSLHLSIYP